MIYVLNNFITVFFQVLSLFLMMSFGFVGQKTRLISEEGSKVMSDLVMYFVTPCLIINSFSRKFDASKLKELLFVLVIVILIHIFNITLATIIFKDKEKAINRVFRFGVVFANSGYMGIPLQQAIFGDDGVFYGTAYVVIFQLTLWSYGLICMSGDKKYISAKKLLINPGIIGTILGLTVFITSLPIPNVLSGVISSMASLNTPLAMIVIGFSLAKSNFLSALKLPVTYLLAFLRLIFIPLVAMIVLYIAGVRGIIPVSIIVSASAPIAAATTMFATRFENDSVAASNLVAITTILSIITMPAIVAFAQSLFL